MRDTQAGEGRWRLGSAARRSATATTVAGLRRRRSSSRLSHESRLDRSRRSPTSSAQLCKSMRGRTTVYPLFTLPTSRLVDCAGFDPAPHFLDRQDAPRRLRVHDLFAGVIASYFGPAVDRVRLA